MNNGYNIDTEDIRKQGLINLLKDMPVETLQIAYLYAKNYKEYGEDVTKRWITVTENVSALQKAYQRGYYEGLQRENDETEYLKNDVLVLKEAFKNERR